MDRAFIKHNDNARTVNESDDSVNESADSVNDSADRESADRKSDNADVSEKSKSASGSKERVVVFTACLVDIYNDKLGQGAEGSEASTSSRPGRSNSWGRFIIEVFTSFFYFFTSSRSFLRFCTILFRIHKL